MDTNNKNESFDEKDLAEISYLLERVKTEPCTLDMKNKLDNLDDFIVVKEAACKICGLAVLFRDPRKKNTKNEYVHKTCFYDSSYRKCIDCGIMWVSKTKHEFFPPGFAMCIYPDGTDNLDEYCRECQVKHSEDEYLGKRALDNSILFTVP